MTDNEIIKALELCLDEEHRCGECPYYENPVSCGKAHGIDLLALINRQKEEIESLKIAYEKLYEAASAMEKEFAELSSLVVPLDIATGGDTE